MREIIVPDVYANGTKISIDKNAKLSMKGIGFQVTLDPTSREQSKVIPGDTGPDLLILKEDMGPEFMHFPLVIVKDIREQPEKPFLVFLVAASA